MNTVSVVIIAKNEAGIIERCIGAAARLTNDIVVIDNLSTDNTPEIAQKLGARVFPAGQDSYGANKNKGIALARYDWILSLDADEVPDEKLMETLRKLEPVKVLTAYDIGFNAYFGNKRVRFGSWGRDHHIRLFHRGMAKWKESLVHETLEFPGCLHIKKLSGKIDHFAAADPGAYREKRARYAILGARQYFKEGRKCSIAKLYVAPLFSFFRDYFLYLGFLDGRTGFEIARIGFLTTRLKYRYLRKLEAGPVKTQRMEEALAVDYR